MIAAAAERGVHAAALSTVEFNRLRDLVYRECGIRLPPAKRVMMESRLRKRLKALDLGSFRAYCDYVLSSEGQKSELVPMIDAITTNKTDFFRERAHFDFLVKETLPALERAYGVGVRSPFAVWSAGCSSGEEPYTLAMVLSEYSHVRVGAPWSFEILATDISTRVLEIARTGIYAEELAEAVPAELRARYLLRSKDRQRPLVRVAPDLRAKVRFRRVNFLDADFGIGKPLDVIFCRNVIIYFDRDVQERVVGNLVRHLRPGGYLFMGHSETLNGLDLPLAPVAATVYKRIA